MKPSQTTGELLIAALHRLRTATLAYLPASRGLVQLLCAAGVDEASARILIKRAAEAFLIECEDRHEVFIRNRVREVAEGPLIGRFLVAPVRADDATLLGVLIGFREPGDVEFTGRESRLAARFSHLLAASMIMSRDALTGLLLPAAFEKQLAPYLTADGSERIGALLYGNIDQLSIANELWGVDAGDEVILGIARQLQTITSARGGAAVCRLAGDRFAVFLPESTLAAARQLADEMRTAIATIRIATGSEPISPRISWGVATLRSGKYGLAHSLASAEAACRQAKAAGGNRTETHQDGDLGMTRRSDELLIVHRLRAALDAGRFEVLGQPINSLLQQEDQRRYEMLVRILGEDDKLIAPAQFMPAATRYQLLPKLDRCVISRVLSRLRDAARQPGFIPLQASFNLSAATISDASFVDWLTAQIGDSGIPGSWLTFELSESIAFASLPHTQRLMERAGALGCRFALDHCGAGMTPLGSLRTLNFSSIKIHSSLVRDLLTDARAEALVKAIASLANTLGLETVAEHVESPVICMRLIELQVQFGQGYAIGRPTRLDRISNPVAAPALARAS